MRRAIGKIKFVAKRNPVSKVDTSGVSQTPLNNSFAQLSSCSIENLPEASSPEISDSKTILPSSKMGRVILRRETSGRGGKTVIVISNFIASISNNQIEELSRHLRKQCGCGGTVHNREIEIQGDQPARIRQILEQKGFQVAGVR